MHANNMTNEALPQHQNPWLWLWGYKLKLVFYYYYIPRLSDCLMPRDRTEAQTGGGGWESYFTISVLSFTDDAHQILFKVKN